VAVTSRGAVQPYLSDPRVTHLVTGRELDQAEKPTTAFNQGDGRYFAIATLKGDDCWRPGHLPLRVDALETHLECGFVFLSWVEIDENGEFLSSPIRFRGLVSRKALAGVFFG
jgi:hypothetical protein